MICVEVITVACKWIKQTEQTSVEEVKNQLQEKEGCEMRKTLKSQVHAGEISQ